MSERVIPRLHLPLIEPEDVVRHLGHQERHWKAGRSAHALTHIWAKENGLPRSIRSILQAHPIFRSAELIDGFLERQVDLGSAGRPSQTDLRDYASRLSQWCDRVRAWRDARP